MFLLKSFCWSSWNIQMSRIQKPKIWYSVIKIFSAFRCSITCFQVQYEIFLISFGHCQVCCSGHGKNGSLSVLQQSIRPETITQVCSLSTLVSSGFKALWNFLVLTSHHITSHVISLVIACYLLNFKACVTFIISSYFFVMLVYCKL